MRYVLQPSNLTQHALPNGPETTDILDVLEHSSVEEVCNYDSGHAVDISDSDDCLSLVSNSENENI
jgi:hypothetical protein